MFAINRNLKITDFNNNKIKFLLPKLIANAPLLVTFEAENRIKMEPEDFKENNPDLKTFNIAFTMSTSKKNHVNLC